MASFFYLSSSTDNNGNNNNNKGDADTSPSEIYAATSTGVLELWPQHEPASSSPVAAAAPGGISYDTIGYHFGGTALLAGPGVVAGSHVRGRSGSGASAVGGMNCLDCGNQAKKQCAHMRCRTCCKSRSFNCETHVKSTWVSVAKRREKQQMQLQIQQRGGGGGDRSSGFHVDLHRNNNHPSKRSREIVPNSITQGLEVARTFPEEVSTTALLRCVRLSDTAEEAGDDEEYAYQATVSISGHIFKGLLYDQGGINADAMAQRYNNSPPGESSSGCSAAHSSLNLITPTVPSGSADVGAGSHPSSVAMLDPSLLFPAPLNAFMTGTQFFPPPRS